MPGGVVQSLHPSVNEIVLFLFVKGYNKQSNTRKLCIRISVIPSFSILYFGADLQLAYRDDTSHLFDDS